MNSVLKFDRVILTKELNERFCKVGEVFEIAVVMEGSFLLREASTKVAIGVISFDDFERCFTKEEAFKGWTKWTKMTGLNGQSDVFYRTNGKKVQVRFLKDKVRSEASCHMLDEFNLFTGISIAYLRCVNKVLLKNKVEHEKALNEIDIELMDNNKTIKNILSKLRVESEEVE